MPRTASKARSKTKTVPYDVSEQLRTPEEMAAYLDAWFAEAPDDAAGIARALGDILRRHHVAEHYSTRTPSAAVRPRRR
jgi:DNA-binding phage protein